MTTTVTVLLSILGGTLLLLLVGCASSLRIVKQYEEGVLFHLGRVTGVRIPWIAAATLGLVPLVVLALGSEQATATRALLLALDALLAAVALAVLRRWAGEGRTTSDVRLCWIAGGAAAWAGGFTVPVSHLLYGLGGASLPVVLGGLVASGCAAAVTAWTVGDAQLPWGVAAREPLAGASALTLVCALALPVQAQVDIAWWAGTVIASALLVLGAATRLPADHRRGPVWTSVATAFVAFSTELPSVSSTLAGQVGWIGQPWKSATATVAGPAAAAVAVPQQFAGAGNLVAMVVAAVMALAAGFVLGRLRLGILVASGSLAVAVVVAVPQLGGSYGAGLGLEGGLTVAAAIAAALLQRRSQVYARTASVVALGAGALALSWSLALPATSAIVAGWLVATLLAAATVPVPWREAWLGAAALAAGYAAVGVAHQLGAHDESLGVFVVGVALVVALLLLLLRSQPSRIVDVVDGCSGALAFVALAMAGPYDGWLSWTLVVTAAWAAAVCVRPHRRVGAPAAAVVGVLALAVLPAAQDLTTAQTLTSWVALVGLAVIGAVAATLHGGEPGADRRRTAMALALSALPVVVATLVEAQSQATGLTASLAALCAVFAAVAAAPDILLTARAVDLRWRAGGTGLAVALLLGATGSAGVDAGLSPGAADVAVAVVAVVAGLLAVGAGRVSGRQPDALVTEVVCAFALVAAACRAVDATSAGWVTAVAGAAVLLCASSPRRRVLWPLGVLLVAAASWIWLGDAGVASPEPYTDPVAVVALVAGYLRRRNVPATTSFVAYGPGLVGLLVPSLLWAVVGGTVERPLLLAALATAVVIVGAQQGLRAPLIIGGVTLVTTALRLMAPYETMVPRWVEVGSAGTLLLVLGATYEQRRRDVQLLRARYDALL